jgi:phage-related protein
VIDKNKIASVNAWLVLIDIEIKDTSGTTAETLRIVQNKENYVYKGNTYTALNFQMDFTQESNNEPSMSLTFEDVTGAIRDRMEEYNGGIGSTVKMMVVNTGDTDGESEIEDLYDVISATANGIVINWKLGSENPLKYQFPYRRQYRDRCPWVYKGARCGYSGALPSCDYTLNGANGCRAHNNIVNFGGFPALRNQF